MRMTHASGTTMRRMMVIAPRTTAYQTGRQGHNPWISIWWGSSIMTARGHMGVVGMVATSRTWIPTVTMHSVDTTTAWIHAVTGMRWIRMGMRVFNRPVVAIRSCSFHYMIWWIGGLRGVCLLRRPIAPFSWSFQVVGWRRIWQVHAWIIVIVPLR